MSWLIALPDAPEQDFNIPTDGSVADAVRRSWETGPLKVIFVHLADVRAFVQAWSDERDLDDIWQFYRYVAAEDRAEPFGPEHPDEDELMEAIANAERVDAEP